MGEPEKKSVTSKPRINKFEKIKIGVLKTCGDFRATEIKWLKANPAIRPRVNNFRDSLLDVQPKLMAKVTVGPANIGQKRGVTPMTHILLSRWSKNL